MSKARTHTKGLLYKREKNKSKKQQTQKVNKTGVKRESDHEDIGLDVSHVLAAATDKDSQADSWIVDSGATCHICSNKKMFHELINIDIPQNVTLGDGRNIETTEVNGTYKSCILHDVLYVPELSYNLLSIAKATEFKKKISWVNLSYYR